MIVYLLLYVDGMIIASKDKIEVDRIKQQLHDKFEIKDLGSANRILGMEITRDEKGGILHRWYSTPITGKICAKDF